MDTIKPDVIILDRESKKKCSICPLSHRPDLIFFNSNTIHQKPPDIWQEYIFLHVDGKLLEPSDRGRPLLLLDASWKRALQVANLPALKMLEKRSISNFATSYPRTSKRYVMPEAGLASVEALYAARLIQGREDLSLLDYYYWKEAFLQKNQEIISHWRNNRL